MTDNDADLQAQYDALQARVNQAKQEQQQTDYYYQAPYPARGFTRGNYRVAKYPRGRGRGRGRVFQNKTLVLNNANTTNPTPPEAEDAAIQDGDDLLTGLLDESPLPATDAEARAYVTKRGASNQLVAKDIHDQELGTRKHYHNKASPPRPTEITAPNGSEAEIDIQGIKFKITAGGSKLMRVTGKLSNVSNQGVNGAALNDLGSDGAPETPKELSLHGGRVKYKRSKHGNLLRIDPISISSKPKPQCRRFMQTGQCYLGGSCKFAHDPKKIAICKAFLTSKDGCNKGARCDLSHKPAYERVPVCAHFVNDRCRNADTCRYAHVNVNPGPLVCRDFAMHGYCDKGTECDKQHIFECPDFAEKGECKNLKLGLCKLTHVTHAHIERRAHRDDESEFESSDEDETEEDDVEDENYNDDDDDEELVMTGVDAGGHSFTQNQDFVSLR